MQDEDLHAVHPVEAVEAVEALDLTTNANRRMPKGWRLRTRRRGPNGGVTRADAELIAPDNVRIRSRAHLARYCALNGVDIRHFGGIPFCNTKRHSPSRQPSRKTVRCSITPTYALFADQPDLSMESSFAMQSDLVDQSDLANQSDFADQSDNATKFDLTEEYDHGPVEKQPRHSNGSRNRFYVSLARKTKEPAFEANKEDELPAQPHVIDYMSYFNPDNPDNILPKSLLNPRPVISLPEPESFAAPEECFPFPETTVTYSYPAEGRPLSHTVVSEPRAYPAPPPPPIVLEKPTLSVESTSMISCSQVTIVHHDIVRVCTVSARRTTAATAFDGQDLHTVYGDTTRILYGERKRFSVSV